MAARYRLGTNQRDGGGRVRQGGGPDQRNQTCPTRAARRGKYSIGHLLKLGVRSRNLRDWMGWACLSENARTKRNTYCSIGHNDMTKRKTAFSPPSACHAAAHAVSSLSRVSRKPPIASSPPVPPVLLRVSDEVSPLGSFLAAMMPR